MTVSRINWGVGGGVERERERERGERERKELEAGDKPTKRKRMFWKKVCKLAEKKKGKRSRVQAEGLFFCTF